MDIKTCEVPSFSVLLMEPDGDVVRTPLSVRLPILSVLKKKPAIVVGDLDEFETLFRVKDDKWSNLVSGSPSVYYKPVWNTYRGSQEPRLNHFKPPQTPADEHLNLGGEPLCFNHSTIQSADEEQLCLANQLQANLKLEEGNKSQSEDERDSISTTSTHSTATATSNTTTTDITTTTNNHNTYPNNGKALAELYRSRNTKKRRRFHVWKWSNPEVNTEYSSLISSKAAFKFAFYCIYLRAPKRVFSMDEYRTILANLGYTNLFPEIGLLNSARSHMRHFRKWEPNKPRGSRCFLQMATNEKIMQQYLRLADALLAVLN